MTTCQTAELSAICSSLGSEDVATGKYYADPNALEALKDLVRYLRHDTDDYEVRCQLGQTNIVVTDLLPLLKHYWEEEELFDVVLKLLVNLTAPPLILWNDEEPMDKLARKRYLEIECHLKRYKSGFAESKVWGVLSTKLSKLLELGYAERSEEKGLCIERILVLVRNVLFIRLDPEEEKRPDNDANTHDQVLWALYQSGMMDIILYISGSEAEKVYFMHILEILSCILTEQNASDLAKAALERNETEKIKDEAQLLAHRHKEQMEKRKKIKMFTGARHSNFGGTYVVKSMNSIGDNELIYHKPLSRLDQLTFDSGKQKPKKPKNRAPVIEHKVQRHSPFSIRLFLKEFCIEFLNGAYNTIMYNAKRALQRNKAQENDESYYLWAMKFFMEFNRNYKFEVKLVSETTSLETFYFVQKQMEHYFDMINSDKKKQIVWSKRLHQAILAYRELLLTVAAMDASSDEDIRKASKVIKTNIFYIVEYRELILTLLVTYDELKMSQLYLNDLIETQHVFLKMLEKYCKSSGTVIVAEKKKKRKKSKKKCKPQQQSEPKENLQNIWDELNPQLTAALENPNIQIEVTPFDAASETPIDEQKEEAVKKIQSFLKGHQFEEAIAMLRAAREVWPEDNVFGSAESNWEEEFMLLQEVFFADLGVKDAVPHDDQLEADSDVNEEEEEAGIPDISESTFSFEDFTKRLANTRIIRACGLSLRNFTENSINTNHCIIKLLHRIAFDNKMYVLLFQASIFRTFQKIFELKDVPQYKELIKFATYIIKQFFIVAKKNDKIYMEMLFWKTTKDAYEIEHGYGETNATNKPNAWTEVEEDELRRLVVEHQQNQIETDLVNWVKDNLVNQNRTRRSVLMKLKQMHLISECEGLKKSRRRNAPWTQEEENELQELYEQFKDSEDPLGSIMMNLTQTRPKNRIVEKMLVMGLISDKSQLRKKRKKNPKCNSETTKLKTNKRKERKQKPKRKAIIVSPIALKVSLIAVFKSGFKEPLNWLKESFEETADDLENATETGDVMIPLVPITDVSEQALESADFQSLLKDFGMLEPDGEQEVYWRIPGSTGVDVLRSHCGLIKAVLDGVLNEETLGEDGNKDDGKEAEEAEVVDDAEELNSDESDESDDDDDDDDDDSQVGDLHEDTAIEDREVNDETNEGAQIIEELSDGNSVISSSKSKGRKKRVLSLSDESYVDFSARKIEVTGKHSLKKKRIKNISALSSDDENTNVNTENDDDISSQTSTSRNNRHVFDSDDSNSETATGQTSDKENEDNNLKRNRSDSSLDGKQRVKRSKRILSSDEED